MTFFGKACCPGGTPKVLKGSALSELQVFKTIAAASWEHRFKDMLEKSAHCWPLGGERFLCAL
jgi:hypothetical protein